MADVSNGNTKPQEPPGRRMQLLQQIVELMQAGSKVAGQITVAGIRAAMPILELYAGTRKDSIEGATRPGLLGLSLGEQRVLNAAATKALLELLEITSITNPAYKDAPRFVAYIDGQRQTPHLMHLLSLAAAANGYFSGKGDEPEPPQPPVYNPDANRTVAYLATAPGEYAAVSGPLPPIEIRRSAMRQRSYAQPQAAMMVEGSDPAMITSAGNAMRYSSAMRYSATSRGSVGAYAAAGNAHAMRNGAAAAARGGYAASRAGKGCGCGGSGHGCSCGGSGHGGSGHGCGCGCGGARHRQFAPARYNDDGSCATITTVSCDTRWRMRECFKVAFCDLLRCLGDELCDENRVGAPDLGNCIEGFVCSLIGCLPDAICPPPEPVCCEPERPRDCLCNFAVGE